MFDLKKSLGAWTPEKGEKVASDNLKKALQALTDTTYRGGVAGLAGAPMDMTNMLANALRTGSNQVLGTDYKQVENPIGGSEWIGKQLENAGVVSPTRRPVGELLAGLVDPATMGAAAVKGAPLLKSIFAGVKAKNADLDKLAEARRMLDAGLSDSEAWAKTGWTHGFADKMPRFEIDDSAAKVDMGAFDDVTANPDWNPLGDNFPISGVLEHKNLYANYPDTENIPTYFLPNERMKGAFGAYSNQHDAVTFPQKPKKETISSAAIHELQHAIQNREGFSTGASPEDMRAVALEMLRRDIASGEIPSTEQAMAMLPMAQQNAYQRLAGEAEARLVQSRLNMTPKQRAASYPVDMFDVPVKDQIVRFK